MGSKFASNDPHSAHYVPPKRTPLLKILGFVLVAVLLSIGGMMMFGENGIFVVIVLAILLIFIIRAATKQS